MNSEIVSPCFSRFESIFLAQQRFDCLNMDRAGLSSPQVKVSLKIGFAIKQCSLFHWEIPCLAIKTVPVFRQTHICDSLDRVCDLITIASVLPTRCTKFHVCSWHSGQDAYRGQSMVRPDDAFDETPVYAMV